MGREIQRSYLPTPELLKDGVRISTVPINLAAGDWNGLNRLLETMRKAIIEPQGTITGRTFRTAVEPDKRVEIDSANGIRIYDSNNDLVAQLDGDELTIAGGTITGGTITGTTITGGTVTGTTIIGSTFKTASSPSARVEIDSTNGIRIYNSANTLVAQLTQTLVGSSYFTATEAAITGSLRISSIINAAGAGTAMSINAGTGPTFGGSAEYIIDGSAVQGKHQFKADGTVRVTIAPGGLTINSGHLTVEGITSTGATGTGKIVFDGTPTLVTPNIGAATGSSLTVTGNITSSPVGILILGNVATSGARLENTASDTITVENHGNTGFGNLVCGVLTPSVLNYTFAGYTGALPVTDGLGTFYNLNFADGIMYFTS